MGCIQARITRIGESLRGTVTRATSALKSTVSRIDNDIIVNVSMLNQPLRAYISDAAVHPQVKVSLVCTLKDLHNYLLVSPEDVQWITSDYGVVYHVESDLEWIIVTS